MRTRFPGNCARSAFCFIGFVLGPTMRDPNQADPRPVRCARLTATASSLGSSCRITVAYGIRRGRAVGSDEGRSWCFLVIMGRPRNSDLP